jgi:hypothetical protein
LNSPSGTAQTRSQYDSAFGISKLAIIVAPVHGKPALPSFFARGKRADDGGIGHALYDANTLGGAARENDKAFCRFSDRTTHGRIGNGLLNGCGAVEVRRHAFSRFLLGAAITAGLGVADFSINPTPLLYPAR